MNIFLKSIAFLIVLSGIELSAAAPAKESLSSAVSALSVPAKSAAAAAGSGEHKKLTEPSSRLKTIHRTEVQRAGKSQVIYVKCDLEASYDSKDGIYLASKEIRGKFWRFESSQAKEMYESLEKQWHSRSAANRSEKLIIEDN